MSIVNSQWSVVSKRIFCVALCTMLDMFDVFAQAQQADKIQRVGFLSGAFPSPLHWTTRLRAALRELGYVEGKNITIESRYSENRLDRLPTLAEELVRLKPDVIVAGGRNDTRAARNATRTIPIVGQSLLDPVADGLLDSLARPGGNVTGFTPIADVLVGKRLELLKETVANLSPVSVLWNPQDPGSARQWKESQTAARGLGLQLRSIEASSAERLDGAFKEVSQTRGRRSRYDIECVCQCSSKTDRGLGDKESDARDLPSGKFCSRWRLDVVRGGGDRTLQTRRRDG